MNNPSEQNHPDRYEPTREDVLIGRVVDGEASSTDWDALERLSRGDTTIWERVGRAQRTHARLEREVEDAIAVAELIEAPSQSHAAGQSLTLRLRQYGGWAAAAAVALAWVSIQSPTGSQVQPTGGSRAAFVPSVSLTPDEALAQYVRAGQADGRVVGELQPMLVNTRSLGEGQGKEVWYVRPILERATVTDLSVMSVEMDEHGTPRYVPLPVTAERQVPVSSTASPAGTVRTRRGGEAL